MTAQELKNSILQLAIQGKLVEQRPEEGTAQELYAQIQAEKQRLIKEGKLKKEKPLPEITEDEKPFEIPEGWMWVRIGQIFSLQAGKNITSANIYEQKDLKHPYLCYGGNGIRGYVSSFNREGHFALIGRQGALCGNINVAKGKFYATEHAVVVDHFNQSDIKWGEWFLKALNLNQYATATAQPGLAVSTIIKVLIPLPPLAEQKRIVAKIEELLPLVDRYEQAWTKLEDFNRRFPEDMKKSILQQAIQGKLVKQRPEEGTAQELYSQIQAEKQRLIKEGKLKKEKPLPEITEDEKPFEIPEGWMWVRLGTLTEMITSGSRDWAKYYSETGDIFLRMGNLSKNSFDLRLDKIQRVTIPGNTEGKRTSLQAGDLLFSITGDVGMLGLIPPNFGVAYINQHTAMLRFMEKERNRYIPYLLLTDYAQKFYNGNQHGIKNSFRLDSIAWLPVPLPPLIEQKRIVDRLEELLPLCERLTVI